MEMLSTIDAGTLHVFPVEILHLVCSFTQGRDLAALRGTCSDLKTFVDGNQLLHREIYLKCLDYPPEVERLEDFDWQTEVQQMVRLELVLRSTTSVEDKLKHLPYVAKTITRVLSDWTAPNVPRSQTIEWLAALFPLRGRNRTRFTYLCQSSLFARAYLAESASPFTKSGSIPILVPNPSFRTRQLSAKLHVLYGHPIDVAQRGRYQDVYPFACSVVYDLRRYTEDGTFWGPFLDNGRAEVDWEKMEAVMVVVGRNLNSFWDGWTGHAGHGYAGGPWEGAVRGSQGSLDVTRTRRRGTKKSIWTMEEQIVNGHVAGQHGNEAEMVIKDDIKISGDPYGVEGSWLRIICFLDFEELFSYNFSHPLHGMQDSVSSSSSHFQPRPPISTQEVMRLIVMKLHVVEITPPGPEDGQDMPVVHFRGSARGLHAGWDTQARANLRGLVRLTREGEVRWTTWSIYPGGEERWKSEGIQVGGPRSARGVLGHWFDKSMDPEGPAGPTYFYKVSEATRSLVLASCSVTGAMDIGNEGGEHVGLSDLDEDEDEGEEHDEDEYQGAMADDDDDDDDAMNDEQSDANIVAGEASDQDSLLEDEKDQATSGERVHSR